MITHGIILLLSLLGALLVVLTSGGTIGFLWGIPLFFGFWLALQLLLLLTIPLIALFLPKVGKPAQPKHWVNAYIRMMMRWLMPLCNLRVTLEGAENIPAEPCILVSNHRSMLDPLVLVKALPRREVVFISKVENFKIPIARKFFSAAGYLPIDRDNAMQAMREMRRGVGMMKESGVDIGIYPEGTRSRTGELLEFKSGAFLLAKKANAPVVVITTKNTAEAAKRLVFRHTHVALRVVDVLDTATVQALSIDEISARVRASVEAGLSCADEEDT
jgi:1-acyl-sn-glycerol-3-phosphate acyltransferase